MKNQKQESNVVPIIDPSQIVTLEEVAQRLKVSPRWVYEKSRNGTTQFLNPDMSRFNRVVPRG